MNVTVPTATSATGIRPLLKWVGGKRQLLPELRRFYPDTFNAYIEPFFGSGAVFFDLYRHDRLEQHETVLIDSNADLIGCYEVVRDRTDEVADALEHLERRHQRHGREHYYRVRDEAFNPARDAGRAADGRIAYTPELAAMLIYLNRTGFNGLFRVNARGAFNVPAGRYDRPRIADRARLREFAGSLSGPHVQLMWGSFARAKAIARRGDFLYFDPPYAPLSPTSAFTGYTTPRFGAAEQIALQALVLELVHRGCYILLSNSTADEIRALYDENDDARRAGLTAWRVPARRAINSKAARRGAIDEYLITNLPRRS